MAYRLPIENARIVSRMPWTWWTRETPAVCGGVFVPSRPSYHRQRERSKAYHQASFPIRFESVVTKRQKPRSRIHCREYYCCRRALLPSCSPTDRTGTEHWQSFFCFSLEWSVCMVESYQDSHRANSRVFLYVSQTISTCVVKIAVWPSAVAPKLL